MAQEWYVKIGDESRGPVGAAKLKQYATEGRLKPDMQVRCGAEGPWVPANKIKGLFPPPPKPKVEEVDIFADVPFESGVPLESSEVSVPAPQDDRTMELPAFGAEPEEEVPFDALPTPDEPVIDVIPQIQVEPRPLVPVKASKTGRKGKKSQRDEPEEEEPATSKAKGKGKRRKKSRGGIQQWLGVAAAVALVLLGGALGYVLWPKGDSSTALQQAKQKSDTPTQPVSAPTQTISRADLFKANAPAVAFIKGRLSTGTGWMIAPNLMATNRHVIEGELMRHIEVHFPSAPEKRQGPYKAKVIYIDIGVDLAFLEVETSTPPLQRASNFEFVPGTDITVIGCPGVGPDLTIKNGIFAGTLSSADVEIDGNHYDQLSISVNPGNSGGPVFDDYGRVIGVVTLKATNQEGIGFSIPMAEVDRLLKRAQDYSKDQIAEARALHRARVVITYLEGTGKLYKAGMEGYLAALQHAKKHGKPAASVEGPREYIKEELQKMDEILFGDLEKEFTEIEKDERLEEKHRQAIVQLGDVYRDMKKCIEEPSKDIDAFAEQCKELAEGYDRLVKELAGLKGK